MKRLLLLLLAAAGTAVWWRRRSADVAPQTRVAPGADELAASDEPPQLGGDVDPQLLEILACPLDKQPITREGNFIVCSACQRHYPIRDGIPVMLVDEALTPEQARALAQ